MIDFYEYIGVEQDATVKEINKAYHKRALEIHPDIEANPEHDIAFLNHFRDFILNPDTRRLYDETREFKPLPRVIEKAVVMLRASIQRFLLEDNIERYAEFIIGFVQNSQDEADATGNRIDSNLVRLKDIEIFLMDKDMGAQRFLFVSAKEIKTQLQNQIEGDTETKLIHEWLVYYLQRYKGEGIPDVQAVGFGTESTYTVANSFMRG